MSARLTVTLDSGAAIAALGQLQADLDRLLDRAPELAERLVEIIHVAPQLLVFKNDGLPAPATGHLRVVAQPSHGLAVLMAAARAGHIDIGIIEQAFGHVSSPSVGLEAPTIAESPADAESAGGEAAAREGRQ